MFTRFSWKAGKISLMQIISIQYNFHKVFLKADKIWLMQIVSIQYKIRMAGIPGGTDGVNNHTFPPSVERSTCRQSPRVYMQWELSLASPSYCSRTRKEIHKPPRTHAELGRLLFADTGSSSSCEEVDIPQGIRHAKLPKLRDSRICKPSQTPKSWGLPIGIRPCGAERCIGFGAFPK